MKKTLFISTFILLQNCTTQEEIRRREMVENLNVQMQDNQKLSTDVITRIQNLEEQNAKLQGMLESTSHEQKQTMQGTLTDFDARLTLAETTIKAQQEQLAKMQDEQEQQGKYIQEVLAELKKLSSPKKQTRSKKKGSPYDDAMWLYRKAKYSKAKPLLEDLISNKAIRGNQKARVFHNLGMISYMDKDYDQAVVYFSKLYTEHAKSPYIPNGLFFMAKTFDAQKNKDGAVETLQQLVKKYPKWKRIKDAQALLSKLKS